MRLRQDTKSILYSQLDDDCRRVTEHRKTIILTIQGCERDSIVYLNCNLSIMEFFFTYKLVRHPPPVTRAAPDQSPTKQCHFGSGATRANIRLPSLSSLGFDDIACSPCQ